jgi:beta-glucosidase/6-phospho-beta-glucosidase/beta-galactosidase
LLIYFLGKGESIWDFFVHEDPSRIQDETNGDSATNCYHMYKEDVQLLKKMNVLYN